MPTMDEHPTHWKDTLMGWDFWYDAVEYQEKLSQDVEPGMILSVARFTLCNDKVSTANLQQLPTRLLQLPIPIFTYASLSIWSLSGIHAHSKKRQPPKEDAA